MTALHTKSILHLARQSTCKTGTLLTGALQYISPIWAASQWAGRHGRGEGRGGLYQAVADDELLGVGRC